MLFSSPYRPHRPRRSRSVLTDGMAKGILSRANLTWNDGGYRVQGRIIGWKRTDSGTLGAVVAYPVTGARHLWRVNLATGGAKHLCRLA